MSEQIPASIETAERAIRDMAATVLNYIVARRQHPSYGYTKTKINAAYEQMEGAIGLYMVLTGQASHTTVPSLAHFLSSETDERVKDARREWQVM